MTFLSVDRIELLVPTEPNFYGGILLQASGPCQQKHENGSVSIWFWQISNWFWHVADRPTCIAMISISTKLECTPTHSALEIVNDAIPRHWRLEHVL